MRAIACLLVLVLPIAVEAQPPQRRPPQDRPAPRPAQERPTPQAPQWRQPPTPRIGSPFVPAGWQWFGSSRRRPSIGNPYLPAGQQWFGSPGDGRGRRGHGGFAPAWPPFFGGGAYFGDGYVAAEAQEYDRFAAPPPPLPSTGLLRLEITPATGLQYYVDGLFIGSSADLGTEFEMNAGARRVEIRAGGYAPLVFDARIEEGQVSTFRGTLERLQGNAAPSQAPGGRTMYIIRGCYFGNVRPEPADLPAGCDIKRMITR